MSLYDNNDSMIIQIHDTPIINDTHNDIRQRRLLRVSHWGKPASLQSGVAKRCKAAVTEWLEDDDGNACFSGRDNIGEDDNNECQIFGDDVNDHVI